MAFPQNVIWEVRTTGNANNGGGYVPGLGGTDYTQRDTPQYSGTDLTMDGSVAARCTSASHTGGFVAADVGNLIHVTTSTGGWTAGFYEIASVTSGAANLDRAPAAVGIAGGAYSVGGALVDIGSAVNAQSSNGTNSFKIFVQAGTYQIGTTITPGNTVTPITTKPFNRLTGYNSSRTDKGAGGRPVIQLTANITAITGGSASGWIYENLIIDCANQGSSTVGIALGGSCIARNCKVMTFGSIGISCATNGGSIIDNCEVTDGRSGTFAIDVNSKQCHVVNCSVHDNICPGVRISAGGMVLDSLIYNNSGATSDGVVINVGSGSPGGVYGCTIYGNGRYGISNTGTAAGPFLIRNNILAFNGHSTGTNAGTAYGLVMGSAAGLPADPAYDGNVYWNNGTGSLTRNFSDDGNLTTINSMNGQYPYTNVEDIALAGTGTSPFVNPLTDFTPNNLPALGASIRGTGVFSFPGSSTPASYKDPGAVQSRGLMGIPAHMEGL